MKEELTTKMHSEFKVSSQIDIEHKCLCALSDMKNFSYSIEDVAKIYKISSEEINAYQKKLSTE